MAQIPDYYEFSAAVKILSGRKALPNLPYEMGLLGVRRALVVTDRGVVGAGLLDKVTAVFEGADEEVGAVFDETPPDSSDVIVRQVADRYREEGCDCIVALGGGSAIDTAKAANIVISEGVDDLLEIQGVERVKSTLQPFVAIPTTAGTGSEVTAVAVVANVSQGVKMSFTSYKLLPDVAILDPEMLVTMPPRITAATGMDALTHAMEAYYCLQKNPVSDAFAVSAIRLVMANLVRTIEDGGDRDARLAMANAALLAGIAFSNSLVGCVHTMAHACGGVAKVPHGVANSIFLPLGVEFNIDKRADIIAELAPHVGCRVSGDARSDARAVANAVRSLGARLNALAGLPTSLRDTGVAEDQFEAIAHAAVNDGTVAMNPEEFTREDAMELLRRAY